MPAYCIVPGCKSKYKQKSINEFQSKLQNESQDELEDTPRISFHHFPSDPVKKNMWIKSLKLEDKILYSTSTVCSLHFEEKFIDRACMTKVRLKENAIPYLIEKAIADNICNLHMKDRIKLENEATLSHDNNLICNKETNTSPLILRKVQMVEKETRVSPERIWNSPAAQMIKEMNHITIKDLKKRIKVLEQKVREKDKKIVVMKDILRELEVDYISDDED
ncbi:THAP domain-containing protein 2-like [Pogonomyrmex barbatus]|uniref:THAP domain-containing protein 2-like n=1 Tax=Pogonomyrmex barbatus TaxID=144034 RepID=A0A6I9W3H0_9HYME|nr:THAP domain-containing protein 2-like [Pogonomyrmex barbatus]